MMANFRKQKGQQDADNLVDLKEEEEEEEEKKKKKMMMIMIMKARTFALLLHSYAAPTFFSYTQPCAHSHRCFARVSCLERLKRPAHLLTPGEEGG